VRLGRLVLGREQNIYLQPVNGLGNRLRAIQSLYKLAVHTGRRLKIYWGPGAGFSDERFEDLFCMRNFNKSFGSVIEFITEEEFLDARKKYLCIDSYVRQGADYKYYIRDKEKVVSTLLSKSFCITASSCVEFIFGVTDKIKDIYSIYQYNCWVSKLVPQRSILTSIEKVVGKFDKNTIGVHIRRGDAIISPWKNFYAVSKDELFYEHVRNHGGKVFLATDCEKTQQELIRTFGDKIIINEAKTFIAPNLTHADAKPNQGTALVDMCCLARTQKIYGTNWSTFSQIASELSGIPTTKVGTGKKKKETTGIVCAAMNRESILRVSLSSWLQAKGITEIVIVDWSSKNSLKSLETLDPKIKVVRVEDQKYFNLGKAYNLAFNNASCDKILKLDVDYILNPYYNLLEELPKLTKQNFITGDWRSKTMDNHLGFLGFLNGFLYIYRDNFYAAKGYSNFENYGFDDDDLYNKLQTLGYERNFLDIKKNICIYHNPHDQDVRVSNYKEKDWKKSAKENYNKSEVKNFKRKDPGLNLIFSLYDESDSYRLGELISSLQKNLDNQYIEKVHVLLEPTKEDSLLSYILQKLKCEYSHKLVITGIESRPTYHSFFEYAYYNIDGTCIISNSDIYFDESLKHITECGRLEDRFIVLNRHEYENGDWRLINFGERDFQGIEGHDHLIGAINNFSADAWIFDSTLDFTNLHKQHPKDNSLPVVNELDIFVGSMFCDSYLAYVLKNQENLKTYNLGTDIKCYHTHKNWRVVSTSGKLTKKERDDKWVEVYEKFYLTNTQWPTAVLPCSLDDFYSFKNLRPFQSWSEFTDGS
jgi:hypothetical protein